MAPKKKAVKASQTKGSEAENIIEKYLKEQYRPFAINDIVQNLHNIVTKTNAIKALENLVEQERITCKMFGKIAIYVCNEQEIQLPSALLESEITYEVSSQLREELIEIEKDKNDSQAQIQNMLKEPPNEKISEIIHQKELDLVNLEEMLKELEAKWKPENENIIDTIKAYEKKINKEVVIRKRIFGNAVSLLKEAMPIKNMNELLEDIGVELYN